MTVQEFIAELENQKRVANNYKQQMETNNDYAKCYESALTTIAKMCGWEPDASPGCNGCPDDIDSIAINQVKKLVERLG